MFIVMMKCCSTQSLKWILYKGSQSTDKFPPWDPAPAVSCAHPWCSLACLPGMLCWYGLMLHIAKIWLSFGASGGLRVLAICKEFWQLKSFRQIDDTGRTVNDQHHRAMLLFALNPLQFHMPSPPCWSGPWLTAVQEHKDFIAAIMCVVIDTMWWKSSLSRLSSPGAEKRSSGLRLSISTVCPAIVMAIIDQSASVSSPGNSFPESWHVTSSRTWGVWKTLQLCRL